MRNRIHPTPGLDVPGDGHGGPGRSRPGPRRLATRRAAEPAARKPAKKDSSPRIRPEDGHADDRRSSPAEARAGETVTYQVTAKLEPGWHIYHVCEDSRPRTARGTPTFDFFDTGGPEGRRRLDRLAAADPQEGAGLPQPRVRRVLRGRGHLEHPAPGPPRDRARARRRCGARPATRSATPRAASIPGQWTLPDVTLDRSCPVGRRGLDAGRARRARGRDATARGAGRRAEAAPAAEGSDAALVRDADGQRGREAGRAGADPVPALLGARRAVRAGDALRLADGADHGQLLRQAGAGQARGGRPAWRSPTAWRSSASSRRSASSSRSSSRPPSLQNLANNPWLNLAVAGLFLAVRPEPARALRDPPAQLPAQRLGAGARAGAGWSASSSWR